MFSLTVRDHVMVAHSLPDEFFGPAAGLHGATFVVEVTWFCRELDEHGVVVDIGAASTALRGILDTLDYRNLDDLDAFRGRLSTTEVVAQHIADTLRDAMKLGGPGNERFTALDVTLREHPDAWASYRLDL